MTTNFSVANEAELNAAIAAINLGGTSSAINTSYTITITSDFTLTADITPINLASGDNLTVTGSSIYNTTAVLDGNGSHRGFVVNAGSVALSDLSLTGMTAPGGSGGSPSGGGALYVGANAAVVTSAVTFNGDSVHGGTPAGGAIFVAQGGSLDVTGGSVAGSGTAAGNGIFIQGNNSITLDNTTVTGHIADQSGSSLGSGAGSVVIQGAVTLSAADHYTGGTQIDGSLSLMAAGAAGTGAITFTAPTGESLIVGAGDVPSNLIDGFVSVAATNFANADTVDLVGIGSPTGYSLSPTNQLTVSGSQGTAALNLDPTQNYSADTFVLSADSGIGAAAGTMVSVVQTSFLVGNEADLNAILASIDVPGAGAPPDLAYTITHAGGGGGIGVGATGGSGESHAGGTGIVIGAASGMSGTGTSPHAGGAGGADGGGGGAAGQITTVGSGRGGGGSRSYPGVAGDGGVGGNFGGGAASGKAAGFGGGGANSAGGWGGGGSGAVGGFGGGSGAGGGAGGGLGAGGDVFVQQGGSLTIAGGSLTGGAVSGGQGSGNGSSGAALGSGIFAQGAETLTFDPAAGQTLSVGDVIADSAGSGDTGATGVTLSGVGRVVLSATNTYTGGTALDAGTLSLQAPGAAGSGAIAFAYGAATTLIVGAGDVPNNIISGFLPGDVIDLEGIGTATSAVPGAGDILTVSGGTTTVQLRLDPAQNFTGESFFTATDNHGGTLVTAIDIAGDFPPSVSGTGIVNGDDHTPLNPLSGVTVSDVDTGQTETVTVTLSSPFNGALSNLAGGTYDDVHGIYTVSGTAAAVTAALDGLVFTPVENQVAPGQSVTTVINLSTTDGLMFSTAAATTVNITALNDAPVISGVGGALVEGYWNVPLNPFAAGTITDPDVGATESVTFTLSSNLSSGSTDAIGMLSLSMPGMTLTHTGAGTYALSAGSPADVTKAIDALQLTTVPNPSIPGYTIAYVGMSVSDGIAPLVTADAEVLAGLPIFSGVAANQSVVDGNSIDPFSTVQITDSAGLSIQGLTITLFDSSGNYLTPTDANGTLSGADLTKTDVGTYTLTPGSTQAVSAELDALVFTPSVSGSTATTFFNLAAFDGATTSDNQDTSVIAEPACFYRGTRIQTDHGEVPVEELAIGDRVVTVSGAIRPIKWIGRRTVAARFSDPLKVWPIRIMAGALADEVPSRDLVVSPDHALLVDNILIQAGALVNSISIVRETEPPEIFTYFHIELEDHSLILAENTPAETFVDNVDRLGFDNWAEHEALYPKGNAIAEMLHPRAKAYRQVPRSIRERLADRGAQFIDGIFVPETDVYDDRAQRLQSFIAA